jgi:hypothetical protein
MAYREHRVARELHPADIHASSLSSTRAVAGELLVAGELCVAKIHAADELRTRSFTASSSASTRYHSSKKQVDVTLKTHVARVCFKCFRGMSQVLYIDVVKVDRDIAHVIMAIFLKKYCNGYTRMFQMNILNVLSVLNICCKCFYLDVAKEDLDVVYTCML